MTGEEVLSAVRRQLALAMRASMFDQSLPGTGIDVGYSLGLVGTIAFNLIGSVPRHVEGLERRILELDEHEEPGIEEISEWHSRHMTMSLAEEAGVWVASLQASKELMLEKDLRRTIRDLRSVFGGNDFLAVPVGTFFERAIP